MLKLLVKSIVALSAIAISYVLAGLLRNLLHTFTSPISALPGPEQGTFRRGSFRNMLESGAHRLLEGWVQKYGRAIRYYSGFWVHKLLTVDVKALHHVLNHGDVYQKSELVRQSLGSVLGQGLLFVEGADHRRARKVINPAFGPTQVRQFTSTFIDKSIQLRDIWADLAAKTARKDGYSRVDAFSWLNKVTLDIIGLTGFNYNFDSLHADDSSPNELYTAIQHSLSRPRSILTLIQMTVPGLRMIPNPALSSMRISLDVINRVGKQLIAEKKASVLAEGSSGTIEKGDIREHDLLSLLIRSNLAADMPESMRMSDDEILAQVPTFLIAGHETTSTLVSWTLFALSISPAIQTKLRAELRAHLTDSPSHDALNSLEYLDMVVRETLRLYAPVGATQRVAIRDDVIPLLEPVLDKRGQTLTEIRVAKGDIITIPIRIMNRSVDIWGEDAGEYRPERWQSLPEKAHSMPGVYSNLLSFLAGPHACIGFRFSLIETKAILFTIVRAFEFELAVAPDDIERRTAIVGRPHIQGYPGEPQLPLLIRPARDE